MKALYENHYLTDNDVANFARQSFGDRAENFSDVENGRLIQFLARGMSSDNWEQLLDQMMENLDTTTDAHDLATYLRKIPEHWVPFGHPQISIRMSAPVPIARQCFKHKVGMVESEESRRYISTEPVLFIPDSFRSAASNKKQGSAGIHPNSDYFKSVYEYHCREGIKLYLAMIEDGVCPEQARFVLPQGVEVHWVATGSLYAWSNAYNQRSDDHAQEETQDLFKDVGTIIRPLFPVSWQALTQGEY